MAMAEARKQVTTAVKEMTDCPESVKQMFLVGLPNAFCPDAHQYQKEFMSMVRKSFESARSGASNEQNKNSGLVNGAQTVMDGHKAEVEKIQGEEDAAQAKLQEEVAAVEASKATVKKEVAAWKEAESLKSSALLEKQNHETAKAEVENVKNGAFQMLLDGGWDDEEVRDACIDGVCNYLQENGADSVLMAALPKALSFHPSKRGSFDAITVDAAGKAMAEKVSLLTEQLKSGVETFDEAESECLGAWAIMDVAKEQEQAVITKRKRAAADLEEVRANKKLAFSKMKEHDAATSDLLAQAALWEAKIKQLDAALGAIDQLEAGEEPTLEKPVMDCKEFVAMEQCQTAVVA